MQDPIKILSVPIHAMTMQEAVKTLEERMLAKEQTFVVTANAEIIMMCQENAEYNEIVGQKADLVLPDGAGAVNQHTAGFYIFGRSGENRKLNLRQFANIGKRLIFHIRLFCNNTET